MTTAGARRSRALPRPSPMVPDDGTAAAAGGQGSSVREAFRLMSTLLYPRIPVAYLDCCARILQRRHVETVFEERAVQRLCAFPPCGNALEGQGPKFRISLARKEIYRAERENQFCTAQCQQKAQVYLSRLVAKPPQLVPSLVEVFGTDKPNPVVYEKQPQSRSGAANGVRRAPAPAARTVWAKTADLGVVERSVPTALAQRAPMIQENPTPAAPETAFPSAEQAVLIEGFVFPAHKKSLAKKVERKLQQPRASAEAEEVVVSDSDESSEFLSDDDSASTSSLDPDDDDDDDEEEVISSDDLPLFINLWRMFSTWVGHDTTLVVAGRPLPTKPEEPAPKSAKDKKERENAVRLALQMFTERYNAFSLMLARPLPHVAAQLRLPLDRHATHRIDAILKSFTFRDAIDGRNSHQWSCIAALLLIVAHNKRTETMSEDELSKIKAVTKLDRHELEQLLSLFYAIRDESEITVDTDVAPREDAESRSAATTEPKEQIKMCRKCRRSLPKCVCQERVAKTAPASEKPRDMYSVEDIEQMFKDAVTLRELNDDLMDSVGGTAYDDVD